jgi:hypothetical protein
MPTPDGIRIGSRHRSISTPPPAPQLTAAETIAQLVDAFRLRAGSVATQYGCEAARFRSEAAEDPIDAAIWRLGPLAELRATYQAWKEAAEKYDCQMNEVNPSGILHGDPRLSMIAMRGIENLATGKIAEIVSRCPWEANSINAVRNALAAHEASGTARAWAEIRMMARSLAVQMEQALEGPLPTPPATPTA